MNTILLADLSDEVTKLWNSVVSFATERGLTLVANAVAALAIFIIGRWAAKLITGVVRKVLTKGAVDETLIKFLGNIVYGLLLALVVIAAVGRLGVDTTSFAAVLAAAGLAVGLALKDSLGNFAAGVMLIIFKPFKVGDFVEAAGTAGVVEAIHIFSTLMRSGDNKQIIVPNGAIISGTITNASAKPTRRIDLVIGCSYDDDIRAVKDFLTETLAGDDRILADPKPVVAVNELGDSSINFVVRPWVNSGDYWAVRWNLTEQIKLGFDERGFNIPYPTRDIHVHQSTV